MTDLIQDVRDKNWKLFPVTPNAKTPLVQWRTHNATDADWTEGRNYGIDCGRSGLVVVDLDTKNGIDGVENFREHCAKLGYRIPKTFKVHTPSGGVHLYFSGKGIRNSASLLARNVDIRGDGGYVVGPGSEIDGRKYQVADATDVAEMPVWLAKAIKEASIADAVLTSGEWAEGIVSGQDDLLSRKVFNWRLKGLSKEECCSRWWEMAQELPVERPGEPWTAQDFERHYKGADSKVRAKEASEPSAVTSGDLVAPASLELTPLSSVPFRKVEWAWDTTKDGEFEGTGGRFPVGTISIGAGRPGAGKGQFAAWLGARVSTGTLPGCFFGKPKGVIMYSTEDSIAMTIGPRFQAAGADLDRVFMITVPSEEDGRFAILKIKDQLPTLEKLIKQHDIGLIILDPLISVLDGKTDVNSETAVRSELEPFQIMLDGLDCFAFGIMHFRKMKDEDILNMFSGSGAFPRIVRSCIAFGTMKEEDEDEERVISTVKNNLGRTDLPSYKYKFESVPIKTPDGLSYTSKLVITGEAAYSVEEINEGKNSTEKARNAIGRATDWLEMVLSDGPVVKDEVKTRFKTENASDFSWTAVERAARKLSVITHKGFGSKGTWALPHTDETAETVQIDEIEPY